MPGPPRLDQVPLLQALPAEDQARVRERLEELRVPAGATLFERGAPGDRLYLLVEGEAEVFLPAEHGSPRVVLRRLGPGDHFGELALADRAFDPYPFVFFNLVLAVLVALQGPLLMMAQNREAAADRAAAEADYRVNLKNEVALERLVREVEALRAGAGRGPPSGPCLEDKVSPAGGSG